MKTHEVVHHTATAMVPIGQAEAGINNSHKARNFPKSRLGWYVGYHYMIDLNGLVKQYREDDEVGAHCAEASMNFKGIGISLIGNFQTDKLGIKQFTALVDLIKKLSDKHSIPAANVGYHKMYKATACPGKNVIDMFPSIINAAFPPKPSIAQWQQDILDLGKRTKVLNDPNDGLFTVEQYAKMLEINRKCKNNPDFK